jgi:hypothetical protein
VPVAWQGPADDYDPVGIGTDHDLAAASSTTGSSWPPTERQHAIGSTPSSSGTSSPPPVKIPLRNGAVGQIHAVTRRRHAVSTEPGYRRYDPGAPAARSCEVLDPDHRGAEVEAGELAPPRTCHSAWR